MASTDADRTASLVDYVEEYTRTPVIAPLTADAAELDPESQRLTTAQPDPLPAGPGRSCRATVLLPTSIFVTQYGTTALEPDQIDRPHDETRRRAP